MIETLLVLVVVALLSAGAWAPVSWILAGAAGLLGLGLVIGVPTGLWYHVALRRALLSHGDLPPHWWLRPTAYHDRLTDDERPAVLPWFYAGGVGFVFTALSCVVLLAAALRLLLGDG